MLLAVGQAPPTQLRDAGVVVQGGKYVVQGFAASFVHTHIAAGHDGNIQFAGQLRSLLEMPGLVIAQQVADSQPYPSLAQAGQLLAIGPIVLIPAPGQPDQQAALEVEDDIANACPVFTLGAASPGHADQPGQFTVGSAGGNQRHQPNTFLQDEFTAYYQFQANCFCRHVGLDDACQ